MAVERDQVRVLDIRREERDRWYGRIWALIGFIGWAPMSLHSSISIALNIVVFDRMRETTFYHHSIASELLSRTIGCMALCHMETLSNMRHYPNSIDYAIGFAVLLVVSAVWATACHYFARANHRNVRWWSVAGFFLLWWGALAMAATNSWSRRRRRKSSS